MAVQVPLHTALSLLSLLFLAQGRRPGALKRLLGLMVAGLCLGQLPACTQTPWAAQVCIAA